MFRPWSLINCRQGDRCCRLCRRWVPVHHDDRRQIRFRRRRYVLRRLGGRQGARLRRLYGTKGPGRVCWSVALWLRDQVTTVIVKYHQVFGVNIVASHKFTCSLDNCERSFYRAFNAIFGEVGPIASEDVIIELLKAKYLPALYYGLEACPQN